MYRAPNQSLWVGRNDQASKGHLWHHNIEFVDLEREWSSEASVAILGFKSDEGVKRNLGRVGAKEGPDVIRGELAKLTYHHQFQICDAGNIYVEEKLEAGQKALSEKVTQLMDNQLFPILIGGGHEISYGHAKGALERQNSGEVGVINFDPHFDLRPYPEGPHSGSWASQLFDEFEKVCYFPIGINQSVNLPTMYELMRERSQSFLTMDELLFEQIEDLIAQVDYYLESVDQFVLTLDLDVFSGAIAPGVSALNAYGAFPQHVFPMLDHIAASPKLLSFDVAEMNPLFDDGRTAKLAAQIIDRLLSKRVV